ncbi:MAG TPA: AAA family ATPase [Pseudonocardiaceae bacterium]|nr:AAA family ATPase [Pseudonocardiaceae bacterium]
MALPLVARSGPLAQIAGHLSRTRAGRGGMVLVAGAAGIGKTRLADEAAAAADGLRVVHTWCSPGGALRPWTRVVRALAAADHDLAAIVHGSAQLAALAGAPPATGPRDPALARWSLSVELTDLVTAAAPLLLVVDDLQDADTSSLLLLADLVPALRSVAVLVLATARDGEHDWQGRPEVWGSLNRLSEHVRPQPLREADVAELLSAAGLASSAAQAVTARTRGNPLLICELITSGATDLATAVPTSVRAMVAARLAGLPERARSTLAAAGVLGSRFRLDVLARLVDDPLTEVGRLVETTTELVRRDEPGVARFRHDLIRDAVHEAIEPHERAWLHRRAATVLTTLHRRGRDVDAAEIAGHLLLAGPDAVAEAAEFALAAGAQAWRRLAFEDAVRWYRRAEGCLSVTGAPDDRRAVCGVALGEALTAAGERGAARICLLDAADRADRAGRPDLVAEAALGIGAGPAGFEVGMLDQRQIDLLEHARSEDVPMALRAMVTARLSIALTFVDSLPHRVALADEAVALARRSGDDVALATALAASCDALAGPDHCARRLDSATAIVAIGERRGDPVLVLLGRRLRLVALLETGAIGEADVEITAYRAVAEAVGHPLYLWYVPLWRGMRALADGRFDECREALREAAELGERAGSANAEILVATQRWVLASQSGDAAGLAEICERFDEIDQVGVWPKITRALLLAQVGKVAPARIQLDAVQPLLPGMSRDSEWLPAVAQVAEAVAIVGPHPVAVWVREALTPYAHLWAVEGIGAALRGPVGSFIALLREPTAPPPGNEFRCHGEYWTIRHDGVESRLRDSKGLRDLAALLARPGRSIAALDLTGGVVMRDTGEVVDGPARAAYRRRLHELAAEADDADAAGDVERARRIAGERDTVVATLTSAYGLGGRVRRTGSSAERARTAVTARIRDAIRRIALADPMLGAHLTRSVHTGTFCEYRPEQPVTWQV